VTEDSESDSEGKSLRPGPGRDESGTREKFRVTESLAGLPVKPDTQSQDMLEEHHDRSCRGPFESDRGSLALHAPPA
jgi:hypothetical protein